MSARGRPETLHASAEHRRKLQLAADQSLVLAGDVDAIGGTSLCTELASLCLPGDATASLFVVRDASGLDASATAIVESAGADRLTWVAYPKAGQLGTDLNRDVVAAVLVARGVRPVRQIALDATWSALQFRPR